MIAPDTIFNDTDPYTTMIFGFNTDIKHEDTIYHVQSEAREGEMLLQTQVFVRGRCIGKHATSYAQHAAGVGFTDQQKEVILRDQHRLMLDAIRDGRVEQVFDKRDTPEALAAVKELDIQWVNSASIHSDDKLTMKLRAVEAGQGIGDARLTVRFSRANAAPFYTQATTDASGHAELVFLVDEEQLPDSAVLVQLSTAGRTATRKFELKKIE